jgi:hypothetical protein
MRVLAQSVVSVDATPNASYETPEYITITVSGFVHYDRDADLFHVCDIHVETWNGDGAAPEYRDLKRWEREAIESALIENYDSYVTRALTQQVAA